MMKQEVKTNIYDKFSKEELIDIINYNKFEIEDLKNKLKYFIGCPNIGNEDPMDGSCVDCNIEKPEQFATCKKFEKEYKEWKNKQSI